MSTGYTSTIDTYATLAATKAEALRRSPAGFFAGAILAGTYIGIAMILALSTGSGLEPGVRPLVMGATFGLGLILTVFAGAELFTGYVMYLGFGLAKRTITVADAVKLTVVVWIGNLVGGVVLSLVFAAGGGGAIFANADAMFHGYVQHKVSVDATALLARAILCNWLVCLAIWTAARMTGDAAKCIGMAWILLAFVAAGFEHSVANMTALTLGLLVPNASIDIEGVIRNLAIVSVGNIIGGLVFVVGGYLVAAKTDVVTATK
ncbi:formate/nitrite transporter family protein [Sphingomonas albertensis]|uniref:Formate/nitrite transporter family protein n=1 Tax=Sphingomonas albertensis TaxID=2762591 RepID=A0ABR7AQ13_9SPHN|nr:formate/nitrite transporter family protein [Sphingomonas albertensis]MBC3942545.1 formate/nitrite transporter family protein [Sphingomonas albertensis]